MHDILQKNSYYCEICSHVPSTASFQSEASLFASDTARSPPETDQLTLHTGQPKSFKSLDCQFVVFGAWLQMKTFPSSEALAIVLLGIPMFGAQATSRTQFVWPARSEPCCIHFP